MDIVVWAQEAVFIHICIILIILDCLGQVSCRCFIWVELPVQRRLCPIFVRNVGSPDIHECFRGLTGSQRTPGFGASQMVMVIMMMMMVILTIKGWKILILRHVDG